MPTATPAPVPTPSPTPIPTPTPTIFEQGEIDGITRSPFNGLAVDDESLSRRILVIKVDNHEEARPQSGIELADMMIEIWVEGITRYLAVFQAADADFIGPIRSMRPTDFALQNSWASTFIHSGGQDWIKLSEMLLLPDGLRTTWVFSHICKTATLEFVWRHEFVKKLMIIVELIPRP